MVPKFLERVMSYEKMSYIDDDPLAVKNDVLINCAIGTNPFGYSDLVKEELKQVKSYSVNEYPNFPYPDLKEAIRSYWINTLSLDTERIVIGQGTMGILLNINKLFIDEKSIVLGYSPQFSDYITDVRSLGGQYEYVLLNKKNDLKIDTDEIINTIDRKHSLVYIDNPNNPTGQIIHIEDLRKIAKAAQSKDVCIVVDEAYGDFMEKSNSAINLIDEFDNVFVVRSLSKGFGLAGLRIGYLLCSKNLLDAYKKIQLPFSVTNHSEKIAITALNDKSFVENSIKSTKMIKEKLMSTTTKLKIMHTDLSTPIIVIIHPDSTVDLFTEFLKRKVLTESGKYFVGLGNNSVRLRIPVATDVDALCAVMQEILST